MSIFPKGLDPNEVLKSATELAAIENKIYQFFMSCFYDLNPNLNTAPDIGGYHIIYLKPPVLSGLASPLSYTDRLISLQNKSLILYAQDITLPEHDVQVGTVKSQSDIAMPYATGINKSGAMTITFMDSEDQDAFFFHDLWVNYIESVLFDDITPAEYYVDNCIIDYATSAYFLKYKTDMNSPVYIGKATGLMPTANPHSVNVGSRAAPALSTFTSNYHCTRYDGFILGSPTSRPLRGSVDFGNIRTANIYNDFLLDVIPLFE